MFGLLPPGESPYFAKGGPYTGRRGPRMVEMTTEVIHYPKIIINMPQKSRKRPITGDMTQMCADLGIEPCLTFADAMAQANKSLKRFSDQLLDKLFMEAIRDRAL